MAGLCNLALHEAVKKVVGDAPYMKYNKENNFVEISLGGDITEHNINGVAHTTAKALNDAINNGVKRIGKVFEPTTIHEIIKGVRVRITPKQLALLDAYDDEVIKELQQEVDEENAKRAQEERDREIEGEDLLGISSIENNIKEGVDFVFEQNPELANIGNEEQYSQYLDTIFPDSKVKDIVYHGSKNKFDNFDYNYLPKADAGFYFTKDKKYAENFGNPLSVLLNVKTPNYTEQPLSIETVEKLFTIDYKENTDALIGKDALLDLPQSDADVIVTMRTEQIHILGSNQDIEGFRRFVKNNQFQQKKEIENDLSKIKSENSYTRGENLDIPASFKILWGETTNSSSFIHSRQEFHRLGYYSDSSILGETNWDSLRELYENRHTLSDMERAQLFREMFISFTRSLYGNKFNKELAKRIGLGKLTIISIPTQPSLIAGKDTIYININEKSSFINHLFDNSKKGSEQDLLDTMISEELIHLTSTKLTSIEETERAFKELTYQDKLYILQTYYHDENKTNLSDLSISQYVHEYVRMQIQKKVLGYTTEEKRTVLAKIVDRVWNYLKDLLKSYTSLNNIYDKTLHFIETGEGKIYSGSEEELGIAKITKNDKVDFIYDKVINIDSRLILHPETSTDKRHYTFDGEKVAKSVTEKVKENQHMPERTPEQKKFDDVKKDWGIEGHRFIENYITLNLIDKDGYIRKTPLTNEIETPLSKGQQEAISNFAKSLIYSYKEGTRILVERKVVNERVKGKLASTMDFLAIEPQENGEPKVDVLDWKFIDIDKNKTEDVPWFKEKEWKAQMGEYAKILYNYGITYGQLRKQRMIPFIMNYEYSIKGKKDSSLVPTSIEVGDINNPKDTKMYLLHVPLNTESTGNTLVDTLLNQLRTQWEKIYSKPVGPEERAKKDLELNQLRKAIRSLHLQMNFEPLISVGETFLKNADELFKSFEGIDYTKLNKEDIQNRLGILLEYKKSAEKFASLDEVYLSHISKDNMDSKEKQIFTRLEKISSSTERMFSKIEAIQKDFVVQLALKEEVTKEETKMSILDAEKAIDSLSKTFLEASFLSPRIIQLATNLMLKAQSLVNRKIAKKLDEYKSIILPLEEEAKQKGKKAFELIGRVTPSGLKLIQKVDREFWEAIKTAKKEKNKQFFLSNMDVEKYNTMAKEAIERGIVVLNSTTFSTDEEQDAKEREFRISKLKDSIDINRNTFNGYDGWQFGFIFNKVVNLENHYSKEYLGMSDNAKKVWEFFTSLNERARQMGYIDKQGMSFFPLIEATTIDKISQTSNLGSELKDIGNDFFKMKINEEQIYSKIDPETGKVKKVIPKYFTRTDKAVEQLSTDLLMVGPLWVKSLYEYENAREMENVLLTLHSVESSKGSLMVDQDKKIIMEAGVPKVNKAENKNADVLQTIVDDYLYDLSEDASSLGNIGISEVAGKFTKDIEQKSKAVVSTKKLLKHSDVLVRVLGVGLKPLIAIANYAGGQFQAFITAGNMYRFRDFEKNNTKITTGVGMTLEEKVLLHSIIPLNEDVSIEKRREMAKGKSLIDFLKTFSFVDVMMITNSFPERRLQYANAMSFNENSMVIDGKIVNIRQWVKEQDRRKYNLSELERKEIEKTYENRVQQLKDTKSLIKIARIENDQLVLDGVSEEELAKYRVKVIEYNRQLNGQMSDENKAGYRRDTILRSFMMFKTWIPKLLTARALDIHKNLELDEWQYGRTRVFFKTWAQLGVTGIFKMRSIISGTDEGLQILDQMLEQKKHEYFLKTGKQLEITQEEFYDLVRKVLSEEMKELGLLFSLMGMLIAAKAAQPPDDASDYEKNQYKFWAKALNKVSDEISFYYNPLSFSQITQGNILPSLNILVKAEQAITALGKEVTGYIIDDEEMIKKAYPTKYFLNLIPGAAQFNSEILPYIYPEGAKELGIRVSTQSRAK